MFRIIRQSLMVMLLGLIFIGQSIASSLMFYSMPEMSFNIMGVGATAQSSHDSSHDKTQQKISGHANIQVEHGSMQLSADDDVDTEDCCAHECQCLASGCSAPTAFAKSLNTANVFATAKIFSENVLIASQALAALYKPPILS